MWEWKEQRSRRKSCIDPMHLISEGSNLSCLVGYRLHRFLRGRLCAFLRSLIREFVCAWSRPCRSSISFSRAAQGNTDLCKYLAQALCFITSRPAKTSLAFYPTHWFDRPKIFNYFSILYSFDPQPRPLSLAVSCRVIPLFTIDYLVRLFLKNQISEPVFIT